MRRFTPIQVFSMLLSLAVLAGLIGWLVPRLRPAHGTVYFFYVEDAAGLPEGTEVKFRGLVVGQVVSVGLDEGKSRKTGVPWFRVEFQANEEGGRVMDLWTFRQVAIDKEVPMVGATVITLADPTLPGGHTPSDEALTVKPNDRDALPPALQEIAANVAELVLNVNSTVQSLRGSLGTPPDALSEDRHGNLALCLQPDVYPLTEPDADSARPTRLAAMLEDFRVTASKFSAAGDSITAFMGKDGSAEHAFAQMDALGSNLQDANKPFQQVFADLKKTSEELRSGIARTDAQLARISPILEQSARNAEEMTDTLKREPWRIVWHSTKAYDDAAAAASPSPAGARSAAGGNAPHRAKATSSPSPSPR
jgi:hypothetical protein